LYDKKLTQREIKNIIDGDRISRGVYEGKGISTNTISRLSPRSKHRRSYENTIRSNWAYYSVPKFIARCLHCNISKAEDVYLTHIIESGISPFDFYDANQRCLAAVRYEHPELCDDDVYIAFTSEDYNEMFELEEDNEEIWTVKTHWVYNDILKGKVTLPAINTFLTEMACGEYTTIFLNTVVHTASE